ncbi:hypothetical protein Q5P01_026401 [Channa striata]|uniref:NAD(P)(+)--arginine ADP-ribosyltransferase n=1 Tax=Channa striata TaxID=64152 RepID=A0AA88INN3_CHASR|nr:hypothetical protein Q5P01_026401 [Channa striata]
MMEVWAAVLILYGVSTGIAMRSSSGFNRYLPLDMAENSVDDMYEDCEKQMMSKAKEYLKDEINKDSNFKKAWDIASNRYIRRRTLRKEQAMAIYVYTLDQPEIYKDFNQAVRTQKSSYKTSFKYHALHFFLTSAIKILKTGCLTGYRKVNRYFSKDVLNKKIRFGSFTSSSLDHYPAGSKFGNKSCFEIETCFGANITLYSKFGVHEKELLIPPYEIFEVTKIETNPKELLCEVVYKLKSTGHVRSDLNCALLRNE